MEYEKLLEEAYKKIEQPKNTGERFEIPKIEGHLEGKKTIINNFNQIATRFRRNPEHLQKFLLKELAVSGQKESNRLVLNRNVSRIKIDEKIKQYAEEFVLCRECKKPDTELIKESSSRVTFVHCLACGAKHPLHSIK